MRTNRGVRWVTTALAAALANAHAGCPPPGWNESELDRLRAQGVALADPAGLVAVLKMPP